MQFGVAKSNIEFNRATHSHLQNVENSYSPRFYARTNPNTIRILDCEKKKNECVSKTTKYNVINSLCAPIQDKTNELRFKMRKIVLFNINFDTIAICRNVYV